MRLNRSKLIWALIIGLGCASTGILVFGGEENGNSARAEEVKKTEAEAAKPEGKGEAKAQTIPSLETIRDRSGVSCLSDPAVIDDLRERRAELEAKGKEIASKEAELKARERALEEQIKKLEAVRDEISKVEDLQKKQNEEKIAKLVETFETMSPKSAAAVMTGVDEALATVAASKISTAKLAKILAAMDPVKSSRLTELMAGVARAKKFTSASSDAAAATKTPSKPAQLAADAGQKGENKYGANHEGTNSIPGDAAAPSASSGASGSQQREPASSGKPKS